MIKSLRKIKTQTFKFSKKLSLLLFILIICTPFIPPTKKAEASGYKVPHVMTFAGVTQSNGFFIPVGQTSMDSTSTVEANQQTYMFQDGTWSGLSVFTRLTTTGDFTITVRKNGVDTALTTTIGSGTAGLSQDLSNSVSVTAGDLISIGVTSASASSIGIVSITLLYQSTSGDSFQYLRSSSSGGAAILGSTTRYIRPAGDLSASSIYATESRARNYIQHDATVVGIGAMVTAYAGTGGSLRFRKTGTNGNHVINFSGTGLYTTTNTDSVSSGDFIGWAFTGSSGTMALDGIFMCVKSTNPREITLMGGKDSARTTSTTNQWHYLGGTTFAFGGAENQARAYLQTGGVISGMRYFSYSNTANRDLVMAIRINGSDGNQGFTYPASTVGWVIDSTNSDTVTSSDFVNIRSARVSSGSGSTIFTNNSFKFTMDALPSTYTQSAYRFFENDDSTDVGSALDSQDTASTLSSTGQAFRLRSLLHIDSATLSQSGQSFKLQYVDKGSGSCASPSGGTPSSYTDVTGATSLAYNDNATPSDGASLTANGSDPTHSGHTVVNQTYRESNNFTNAIASINSGEDGKWDFSLIDNGASASTTFCFRIVKSDGTELDTYSVYPEITTAAASGSLSVDIVDAGGSSVGSPSVGMNSTEFSFSDQTATGTFGTSSEKIRVDNGTGTATWTLSLAADSGSTAFWDGGTDYDFNDPTANAGDGADADSIGGQMTIDPSGATITPEGGCTTTNISLGSSNAYNEGTTDSITLASAASGADTGCYWDITDIDISQTIPAEQPADSYSIDMTLSIIAS